MLRAAVAAAASGGSWARRPPTLDAALAAAGLARHPVPGDGDCQFHALLDQLAHVGATPRPAPRLGVRALRTLLADALEADPRLAHARDALAADPEAGGRAAYLRALRAGRTWGDHYTLAAAAIALEVDVLVVSPDGWHVVRDDAQGRDAGASRPVLRLAHQPEWHYDSTRARRP